VQITFTPSGGSAVTLAGTGREAAQDFALSFSDQVQGAALARAAAVTLYNRGNRGTTLGWSTARSHADQPTAEAFMFSHAAAITSGLTGSLVCTPDGGSAKTFNGAVVRISASRHIGLTTFHTYEAQGTPA
jgi:hypothetical protein